MGFSTGYSGPNMATLPQGPVGPTGPTGSYTYQQIDYNAVYRDELEWAKERLSEIVTLPGKWLVSYIALDHEFAAIVKGDKRRLKIPMPAIMARDEVALGLAAREAGFPTKFDGLADFETEANAALEELRLTRELLDRL